MNNDQNKAHPHPYGSTVIPTRNGFSSAGPTKVPSVAGLRATEVGVAKHPCTLPEPPKVFDAAFDALIDTIADRVADRVVARLAVLPPTIAIKPPEPIDLATLANQMHTDLEQALRERDHVKVLRFAPEPIVFTMSTPGGIVECTAYAQPYGQGYTGGAKLNEYVLLCAGKQLRWVINSNRNQEKLDSGVSFTLDQVLRFVDSKLREDEYGVVELTYDATV